MQKAMELIRELDTALKNRELLSNYQDISAKGEKLTEALKAAKLESDQHFEVLLKKLVREKDAVRHKNNVRVASKLINTMQKLVAQDTYEANYLMKYHQAMLKRRKSIEKK